MKKAILSAAVSAVALATLLYPAEKASAVSCPTIPVPTPCIVKDLKRSVQLVNTIAQEKQKIQQTIGAITSIKGQIQTIGTSLKSLPSFDLKMPKIPKLSSPIMKDIASISLQTAQSAFAKAMFSPTDAGMDAQNAAKEQRHGMVADANADAYAFAAKAQNDLVEAENTHRDMCKQITKATNLREDWAANSRVKLALVSELERRSNLMTQLLKAQSAQGAANMPAGIGQEVKSSSIVSNISNAIIDNSGVLLSTLSQLLIQAQKVSTGNQIVQMSQSSINALNSIVADYQQAVAKKNAAMRNLENVVNRTWDESSPAKRKQILDKTYELIAQWDRSNAALRSGGVSQSVYNAHGFNSADVAEMRGMGVDPSQFIGTWADPERDNILRNLAQNIGPQMPDSDSGDKSSYRAAVQALVAARLEEAWKLPLANDAQNMIQQSRQDIAQQNSDAGMSLTAATAAAKLKQLVAEANKLGAEISSGTNEGAKTAATEMLNQLQAVVDRGTSLPPVDATTEIDPNDPQYTENYFGAIQGLGR